MSASPPDKIPSPPPPPPADEPTLGEALAARILAAGPGWIAIDKPWWMSAHNAGPGLRAAARVGGKGDGQAHGQQIHDREWTYASAWAERALDAIGFAQAGLSLLPGLADRARPEPGFAPAPAHRLDVGTSGVLVMACSRAAARAWTEILAGSTKTYLAVARGGTGIADAAGLACGDREGEADESVEAVKALEWRWPLSERAEGRRDPQGAALLRRDAHTRARIVRQNRWFTWLEAEPITGRTHQIRRHAALAKRPLLGERRYADPRHAEMIEARYGFSRLALHARSLALPEAARALKLPPAIVAPEPAEFARLGTSDLSPMAGTSVAPPLVAGTSAALPPVAGTSDKAAK
jgi:tRNA pseudouridine65 synthase